MLDNLICSRCDVSWIRPKSLAQATFTQYPFVCENCRCKDCSIVLEIECECGDKHAERSSEDPGLCADCCKIRKRIMLLDRGTRRMWEYEILRQDPIYDGILARSDFDSVSVFNTEIGSPNQIQEENN